MTARTCLPYGDPRLRAVSAPVPEITDEIRRIWADMIDTMEMMPGVGLAAVQIGHPLRLAVVDASSERGRAVLMANPEVIEASAKLIDGTEASPHLPGLSAKVMRPRAVTVRFLNADGVIERRDFVKTWARSVQHQIDHMDGKLYVDRLSRLKRDMLLRKAAKR